MLAPRESRDESLAAPFRVRDLLTREQRLDLHTPDRGHEAAARLAADDPPCPHPRDARPG